MAIDTSPTALRRLAERATSRTQPRGARADRAGAPPENDASGQNKIALVEKPRRLIRPAGDPLDLDAALTRLATLLAMEEPPLDAPRGYYLNILV
ncbi:MAG: hypothetical protein ACKVKG_01990 [Alphaproteobacteria bacterium]|jgi:hypothetical protein